MSDMSKLVAEQARKNAEQAEQRPAARYRVAGRSVRVNGSNGFGVVRVSLVGFVAHLPLVWSSRKDAEAVATALNLAARSER